MALCLRLSRQGAPYTDQSRDKDSEKGIEDSIKRVGIFLKDWNVKANGYSASEDHEGAECISMSVVYFLAQFSNARSFCG